MTRVRHGSSRRWTTQRGVDVDQGLTLDREANIVPDDGNGIAFGRTPGQVLNIVYLTPRPGNLCRFHAHGLDGELNASG